MDEAEHWGPVDPVTRIPAAHSAALTKPGPPVARITQHNDTGQLRELTRELFAQHGFLPKHYQRRDRHRALAWARAAVAWQLRRLVPQPSLPVVARLVGLTNHTTILWHVEQHARRRAARIAAEMMAAGEFSIPVLQNP